ncbi:MAG TPA: glycosyltransferase family 87 protein [Planctomycetota bacterium]|nr:glycosyltransferase family 87 protein [Planctomycetota bacterium]
MTTPRGGLLLALALLAGALVAAGSQWTAALAQPDSWAETDYQLHWAAGRALAAARDPYDPASVQSIGMTAGRGFTPFCAATPLFVAFFRWLGERPFEDGYRLLLGLNVLLLGLAVAALAAALRRAGAPGAAALGAALALVALDDGTWMSLWFNQLNFVTLAAVCGALWAGCSGRPRTEGALLALATWAKLSPALILVLAACAGRWRTVRAAVVAGVALLALSIAVTGWDAHVSWLTMARRELGFATQRPEGQFTNTLHAWNLAPNGVLSRAAAAGGWDHGLLLAAVWAVALAAVGTAVLALRCGARAGDAGPRQVFAVYALGVAAGFLASSTTWATHLSLAAVPVAFVALAAWESPRRGLLPRAAGALAAVLLFVPLGTLGVADDQRLDILAKLDGCILLLIAVAAAARTGAPEATPRPG